MDGLIGLVFLFNLFLGFFLGYGYEAPPITGLRLAASAPSTTNAASHRLSAVRVCMR